MALAGCGGHHDNVRGGRWIVWNSFTHGHHTIWIARADGTHRRLLVHGDAASVSPDGRWVAFHPRYTTNLWLIPARGGHARELLHHASGFSWSPTSRALAAIHERGFVLVQLDGHVTTLLDGPVGSWSFSPDGTRIAYVAGQRCRDGELYVLGLDGGGPRRITRGARASRVVWGPGWLAYARDPRCLYRSELWLVRPDGRGAHLLARERPVQPGDYGLAPVAWRRGSLLAGIITEWGFTAITVDPQSGAYRRVHGYWYASDLSHDGRDALVFGGGAEGPYTIAWTAFDGGPVHVVAHGDVGYESWNR